MKCLKRKEVRVKHLEDMKLIMKRLIKDNSCSTWMIAAMLKINTRAARAIMLKMKNEGIVEKHMFSSKNNTVWKLAH